MTEKRAFSVDILKAFAIFLVVLGHISNVEAVRTFIYSFHMPLFMFLSGITFWLSYNKCANPIKYIRKRILSLIVPYCVWGLLSYFIKYGNFYIEMLFYPFSQAHYDHLWFLPTLFCVVSFAIIMQLNVATGFNVSGVFVETVVFAIFVILFGLLFKITGIKLIGQTTVYSIPFFLGKNVGGGVMVLSKNTLAIYIIHEFFRPVFSDNMKNVFYDTMAKSVAAFLLCFICILIKSFIENVCPYLSILLFGSKLPSVKRSSDKDMIK